MTTLSTINQQGEEDRCIYCEANLAHSMETHNNRKKIINKIKQEIKDYDTKINQSTKRGEF
jgi:hypothetical protein